METRTMITETSLEAYYNLELGKRQLEVYKAIEKLECATNTMISKHLKIPINCVTGRTKELREKRLVIESHISWCPQTKNRAKYWKLNK